MMSDEGMEIMMHDNKALVLEALDLLFNRRDYARAEPLFSAHYIQHSRFVPAGRDGLFDLVRSLPVEARHEAGLSVGEGDYVLIHGRYSGLGMPTTIAVDIFRLQDGLIAEHWDVLQEEATREQSAGGHPMFGDTFV